MEKTKNIAFERAFYMKKGVIKKHSHLGEESIVQIREHSTTFLLSKTFLEVVKDDYHCFCMLMFYFERETSSLYKGLEVWNVFHVVHFFMVLL